MKKFLIMAVFTLALAITIGGCAAPSQPYNTPAVNSPSKLLNLPPAQNINTPVTPPAANLNQPVATPPVAVPPPVNVNKPAQGKTSEVRIMNFSFNPPALIVKVGDTVKWVNSDQAPHKIASDTFNSQDLNNGDNFSFTFTKAGTYNYHCSIHPFMTGTINVIK